MQQEPQHIYTTKDNIVVAIIVVIAIALSFVSWKTAELLGNLLATLNYTKTANFRKLNTSEIANNVNL